MKLVRLVSFAALTCGLALSAEQPSLRKNHLDGPLGVQETSPNTLPAPLSSAIRRMVTGEGVNQVRPKLYRSERSALVAQAEKSLAPCSIPLSQKTPAGGRFFIQKLPVPESPRAIDGMASIHGRVCGDPADSHAH